jgi:pSer/pThr/pTyr-binding forkhead associated (FHA) protein
LRDFVIEIVEGPRAGTQVPLTGALEAGRSQDAGLMLDDEQASRRHARIEPAADGAVVADLGSTNGTYVNEQPIHVRRLLRPGDRVRIGVSVLELRTQGQVREQPSAVRPVPPFAPPGPDLINPATASPPATAGDDPASDAYGALARLVDVSVKRQTTIAVFAFLAFSGLVVLIFFGVD